MLITHQLRCRIRASPTPCTQEFRSRDRNASLFTREDRRLGYSTYFLLCSCLLFARKWDTASSELLELRISQ